MNVAPITSLIGSPVAAQTVNPAPLTPRERARAAHLHGAALRNASPAEQRAAVASQFEAIMVRQLLGKTVTSMVGQQNNAASSIYGDMLTDVLADKLTAGSGMGLAGVIEKQLTPRTSAHVAAAPEKP